DLLLADLFLQRRHLRLQLLRFLHHVAKALHWLSPSACRGRTVTISPSNSSIAALTAGWDRMSVGPPSPSATVMRSTPLMYFLAACRIRSRFARSLRVS